MKETTFNQLITNTEKYVEYLKRHYNNVQEAFNEFTNRICSPKCNKKHSEFIVNTKLYDDWQFNQLQEIILMHDLSKLGKEEFVPYRDNFFPISCEDQEENKVNFNNAWVHHKENNKHHWQSRIDIKHNPQLSGFYNDYLAIENAMDWIAMAYEFNEKPLNKYYLDNKDNIYLSEKDKYIIERVYEIMMDDDLKVN